MFQIRIHRALNIHSNVKMLYFFYEYNNHKIIPRDFYHQLLENKLDHGRVEDVCLMRIKAIGKKDLQIIF